ncbi:MAG: hypothetical protein GY729_07645 [Desulfobacteraceae bacterium]|nr:hypothetical protein [Desulfobacteraceae bacterium]
MYHCEFHKIIQPAINEPQVPVFLHYSMSLPFPPYPGLAVYDGRFQSGEIISACWNQETQCFLVVTKSDNSLTKPPEENEIKGSDNIDDLVDFYISMMGWKEGYANWTTIQRGMLDLDFLQIDEPNKEVSMDKTEKELIQRLLEEDNKYEAYQFEIFQKDDGSIFIKQDYPQFNEIVPILIDSSLIDDFVEALEDIRLNKKDDIEIGRISISLDKKGKLAGIRDLKDERTAAQTIDTILLHPDQLEMLCQWILELKDMPDSK